MIKLDRMQPANQLNAIALNGILYDIGVRVRRWNHADGYDGYTTMSVETTVQTKRGGSKVKIIQGKRYSKRAWRTQAAIDRITQLVIHHSGADRADPGAMWNVLYNQRKLSVHFAIEDDGRGWQFNDLIDACWHAGGQANKISIGTECTLYPLASKRPGYYRQERNDRTGNLPHEIMVDRIHGRDIKVFCFTEPQLDTLARYYAGAWVALGHQRTGHFTGAFAGPPRFPRLNGRIPRTNISQPHKHVGLIGHLQITRNKIDPAGFPWEDFEELIAQYYTEFRAEFDACKGLPTGSPPALLRGQHD